MLRGVTVEGLLHILPLLLDLELKFLLFTFLLLPVQGLLYLVHHVLVDVSLKLHILIFAQEITCGE